MIPFIEEFLNKQNINNKWFSSFGCGSGSLVYYFLIYVVVKWIYSFYDYSFNCDL